MYYGGKRSDIAAIFSIFHIEIKCHGEVAIESYNLLQSLAISASERKLPRNAEWNKERNSWKRKKRITEPLARCIFNGTREIDLENWWLEKSTGRVVKIAPRGLLLIEIDFSAKWRRGFDICQFQRFVATWRLQITSFLCVSFTTSAIAEFRQKLTVEWTRV